jgi:beta-1,4-mannosyltransferase
MAAMAHVLSALSNAAVLLFVVTTMLAMGFSLTVSQIFAPLRSVRLVVVALVGNFVLVPLLAIALTRLSPLSEPLKIGVILLGVAAGQIRPVASTLSIVWRRQQVWLHRHGAAIVSGLVFFTIIAIYNWLWTRFTIPQTPDTWYGQAQYCLLYAWLLAVPQTVLNLQGFLFTHPRAPTFTLDGARDALHTPLHIRIVTRGTNPGAVQRTIEADRAVIAAFTGLHGVGPRVTFEVVTDYRVPLDLPLDRAQYVVPADFRTPHGALFKARALQYAVGAVSVAHNAWILHCDEETQLTLSGLTGCLQFMQQEIETVKQGGYPAVGQGAILYHRDFWLRPFLTLADSMRTALDFGYFRVQCHVWHRPLFGLHGSFILVRQDIERAVDFDFDRYRSITEDAYWALRLVERGIGLKWVQGFLSEQATFSVQDFLRQRKRWFTGLWHVLAGEGVRWRTKLVLRASVVSWACGLLGTLAIAIQLIHPIHVPWYILLPASLCQATYTSITVYGLLVNFRELHLQTHGISWLIVLAQIALGPLFAGLEGTAILWALFTLNSVRFHVVKK